MPSKHQGVALRSSGDPVLFLSNPDGVSPKVQRQMLDAIRFTSAISTQRSCTNWGSINA
jgi:hypothetical protein